MSPGPTRDTLSDLDLGPGSDERSSSSSPTKFFHWRQERVKARKEKGSMEEEKRFSRKRTESKTGTHKRGSLCRLVVREFPRTRIRKGVRLVGPCQSSTSRVPRGPYDFQ